jgi:DNA repair protein RecO (recombination protein O)
MIVKTDAVVLKSQKYLESSAIVTFYTRSYGKMSVIAKGARRRQNMLAPALGAMNHLAVIVYRKEGRDLQILSQCELRRPWHTLTVDIDRMALGMAMVELVNVATSPDEQHEDLFALLLASLESIDTATKAAKNALYYFETHVLESLGFKPSLARCVKCGRDPVEGRDVSPRGSKASILDDGILCAVCAGGSIGGPELSRESIQVLRRFQELSEPSTAERIALSPTGRGEVDTALRWLLRRHVIGTKSLKSEHVFSTLTKVSS